jgi:phosphate transport system substrate-binding protein
MSLQRLVRVRGRSIATLTLVSAVAVFAAGSVASAGTVKLPMSGVETPPAASLTETGSTLLYPLWNIWAPAYEKAYPKVSLTTGGTGSGTGIADAASGTVNIGSSDAYLSPSVKQATPGLLNIPLAISYQVIAYNIPGVNAHLKLNGGVIAAIYRGSITKWNDPAIVHLNPTVKLPALPIVALHRSDGSGDTFIFSQYLSDQVPSWAKGPGFGTTISFPRSPTPWARTAMAAW